MTQIVISPAEDAASPDERDVPLPSTESPPEAAFVFSGHGSIESSTAFSFRASSISVSPTPEPEQREYTFSPPPSLRQPSLSRDHTSDQIRDGIAQLHVDSSSALSNLHDLSSALHDVPLGQAKSTSRSSLTAAGGDAGLGRDSRQTTPQLSKAPLYDIAKETYPDDPFNSAEFQAAFLDAKNVARKIADALSTGSLHHEEDSAMHRLYNRSVTLANFKPSETRIVGFVGGTGVGKSSILNSLLDVTRLDETSLDETSLVKSGGNGWACTCAATEFHYHESELLNIEVQLVDKDELLQQQMQHLSCYRAFHSADQLSARDREEMRQFAELAGDTFQALFHSQLPSRDFLLNEAASDVERKFKTLIEALRPSEAKTRMIGLTKQECSDRLLELSPTEASTRDAATRAVSWPYIKKIKVYLNAQILKRGLILVDLPGLRDRNLARKRITELYIRNCHEVFAVCDVGRAADDADVTAVFQLAEHISNISIICTNSDRIDAMESKRDWPDRAASIAEKLEAIKVHKASIDYWEEELQDLEYQQSDLHEAERKKQTLAVDILREKRLLLDCKFQLKAFLVQSRNSDLCNKLPGSYRTDHSNANTKVFCVSNLFYRDHRYERTQTDLAYLHLSGIIRLRQHCVSIVSANQHKEASAFINTDVPKLLTDSSLWVQSGEDTLDGERRAAVTRTLDCIERQLRATLISGSEPVTRVFRELYRMFQGKIHNKRDRIPEWSGAALSKVSTWSYWSPSTYYVFCIHSGKHVTKAVGAHDWNRDATLKMREDLRDPWNTVTAGIQEQRTEVYESLERQTEVVIHQLNEEIADSHSVDIAALVVLRGAFYLEQDTLLDAVEQAYEATFDRFRKLRARELSNMTTSYIEDAMKPAYERCSQDSVKKNGPGVDTRRKAVIKRAFGDEGLFEGVMQKLHTEFRAIAQATQDDLSAAVRRYLEEVHASMDLVRDENTAIESQRDLAFRRRVNHAVEAAQETMRNITSRNVGGGRR